MILGSAGPASAAQRYAAPTGTGPPATCPANDPCALAAAVEAAEVTDGDEVIVTPGVYNLVALDVDDAIDLHGQASQSPPTVNTSGAGGISVTDAATIRDLKVEASGSSAITVNFNGAGTLIDRVSAHSSLGGSIVCNIIGAATVRDTLCWSDAVNTRGLGANGGASNGTTLTRLRNVTAIGTSSGIAFNFSGAGVDYQVDAKGVIADGGTFDVIATGQSDASVQIVLDHSNYADTAESNFGTGTVSVTPSGTGTNQTTGPLFVDAANGDFHQQAGSPTIDAGDLDGFSGTADFDGDARTLDGDGACPAVVDIGADEYVGAALDCTPPQTTIASGPSGLTNDSTPTFGLISSESGSTFQCRVDAAAFAACTSPFTTSPLTEGPHTLDVRATDIAGNLDATQATRSITVDTTAPETTITERPKAKVRTKRKRVKVTFKFVSNESGTFKCALDGAPFKACASPLTLKVGKGKHKFRVRATDTAGNTDPTPAVATFRVKRKRR